MQLQVHHTRVSLMSAYKMQESRDREVNGDRKPAFDFGDEQGKALQRCLAAYEGAKALLTEFKRLSLPECSDAVAKVSMVRRGLTNTRTVHVRGHDEEYFYRTKPQIVHEVRIAACTATLCAQMPRERPA